MNLSAKIGPTSPTIMFNHSISLYHVGLPPPLRLFTEDATGSPRRRPRLHPRLAVDIRVGLRAGGCVGALTSVQIGPRLGDAPRRVSYRGGAGRDCRPIRTRLAATHVVIIHIVTLYQIWESLRLPYPLVPRHHWRSTSSVDHSYSFSVSKAVSPNAEFGAKNRLMRTRRVREIRPVIQTTDR